MDVGVNAALNYVTTGSPNFAGALQESATGLLNPAKTVQNAAKLAKALSKSGTVAKGAKRGHKTDPNAPHNKKIREIGDQIEADGGTVVAGGGRLPEQLIPTPGGHKSGRRPDILYEDCHGNLCGVNVGKT